jgi:hypothetical protein
MAGFPKKLVEETVFPDASSTLNSGSLLPTISSLLFRDENVEYQNKYKNQPISKVLLTSRKVLFSALK